MPGITSLLSDLGPTRKPQWYLRRSVLVKKCKSAASSLAFLVVCDTARIQSNIQPVFVGRHAYRVGKQDMNEEAT